MEQTQEQDFWLQEQENKLPGTLNVLTILTFVGCALGLIFGIWEFYGAEKRYNDLVTMMSDKEKMAAMPEFARNMFSTDTLALAKKQLDNKLPMMIAGVVGVALCLIGAIQMRKRRKQGYLMWLIGELLPIVATFIFIGFGVFKGFGAVGLLFPVVFIILYTVQRKHLTKE